MSRPARWLILLLAAAALAAGCRPAGPHFRGKIIEVNGDVMGRYWLARRPDTVFNLPEPPREDCGNGYVVVRYVIDSLGQVFEAGVVRAEPEDCYEVAALRLVGSWRFQPAPLNYQRTPIRVTQRIPFVTE